MNKKLAKIHKGSHFDLSNIKSMPYIEQIKYLYENYPDNYVQIITRGYKLSTLDSTYIPEFKYLVDWINEQTPLLQSQEFKYTLPTKIYWILNGLTDFPKCPVCGNHFGQYKNIKLSKGYFKHCSNKCAQSNKENIAKIKQKKMDRYGDENYVNTEKCKQTTFQHYGVEYSFQLHEVKEKIKQTKAKKIKENPNYWKDRQQKTRLTQIKNGTFSTLSKKEYPPKLSIEEKLAIDPQYYEKISLKCKHTKLERYGDENYVNVEKCKQTKLERYGDANYNNSEQNKKTCLERYGREIFMPYGSDEFKQLMIEKYGVAHNSQVREFRLKQQSKYEYKGIKFDSGVEIAVYIYLTDNQIDFQYQPNISFEYFFNGSIHTYYPDFKVNEQYWEIKGDHFFKNKDINQTMVCPWDHTLDELYEAKHQCMIQNNIIILTFKDYYKYLKYVYEKYGVEYLKSFKKLK